MGCVVFGRKKVNCSIKTISSHEDDVHNKSFPSPYFGFACCLLQVKKAAQKGTTSKQKKKITRAS